MIRATKAFLILLFCIQLSNANTPTDSLKAQMVKLSGVFKKQGELLKKQNDSLQREILYYKVKEDFYTESLGGQTAIFSFITGTLLTLAAFISWKFISDRISTVKRDLSNEIDSVEKKLEEKQENDIIVRYQTLKNGFDLGHTMLSSMTESKIGSEIGEIDFGIGVFMGITLMVQANQAIKVHPKRLINSSRFNEDPQQFINTFNNLSLFVRGRLLSIIDILDNSNIETLEFMMKMYTPMCEYNLIQLIEDIFEGGRRSDIIEIKFLYSNLIKEITKISSDMKNKTSVIDIESEEEK
ncbi:hypothetical protein [Larkinella humicola]|uniref:Uncharacterized protein n=1 Tax=Larkinella humicola TaxID=2607654 RepID=A0A5N1J887_9BACT|nr:hypothetical protein [Larkinella humicola]KAA9346313.1 hypothetical protein F0P93_29030 [Larkinella humicola]